MRSARLHAVHSIAPLTGEGHSTASARYAAAQTRLSMSDYNDYYYYYYYYYYYNNNNNNNNNHNNNNNNNNNSSAYRWVSCGSLSSRW
jgi:hypothetical protein